LPVAVTDSAGEARIGNKSIAYLSSEFRKDSYAEKEPGFVFLMAIRETRLIRFSAYLSGIQDALTGFR
jgi:uncharacterized protein YmfQ (DUF2313 family)